MLTCCSYIIPRTARLFLMVSLGDNIGRGLGPPFGFVMRWCFMANILRSKTLAFWSDTLLFKDFDVCFDLLCILVKVTFAWSNRDFWSLSVEMLTVVLWYYIIYGLVRYCWSIGITLESISSWQSTAIILLWGSSTCIFIRWSSTIILIRRPKVILIGQSTVTLISWNHNTS